MEKRIILVGCGNIGSRHLQAIAKLPYGIKVDIVEPSDNAQNLAKSRLDEISFNKTDHKFSWYKSISELTDTGDITIVTTYSVGRVDLIIELMNKGNRRFLIEKMVCQSVNEYNHILEELKNHNGKAWVNITPRCFKSYRKIKEFLPKEKAINFSVKTNSKNGLGTNAIHYIDLFSWFINDNKITLDGKSLSNELLANKRGANLKEFSGTITGIANDDSSLSITFLPELHDEIIVEISIDTIKILIDETNGKITTSGLTYNGDLEFTYEHVSSTSTEIINNILQDDNCQLPTLLDSLNGHSELFRIFNAHITKISKENVELCPIT